MKSAAEGLATNREKGDRTMRLGTIGGLMIIGSSALLLVAGAIAVTGGSVGVGSRDLGGTVLVLALGLAGLGAGAIGLAGPDPMRGRWLRIGLTTLAVGIISLTGSAVVGATMTYDPLESLPAVVLLFLGGWTMLGGGIATAVGLLRAHQRPRTIGALFLVGLLLAAGAGILSNEVLTKTSADLTWLHALTTLVAIGGAGAMLASWAGVGFLVISAPRADRAGHP
jgi:hypothetical protein